VTIITKVSIDPTIIPKGFGLGFEQSTWDPQTQRFYASLPTIANNPAGCNYGQLSGPITCAGGMVVIDPTILSSPTATIGAFDAAANVGVVLLNNCGPNGITLGTHGNLMEGCTPGNFPPDTTTLVINGVTKNYATVANITGSDEVGSTPATTATTWVPARRPYRPVRRSAQVLCSGSSTTRACCEDHSGVVRFAFGRGR
jgi:hypothetical protein